MEWLIKKLKEDLRTLQNNYNEFVIEGAAKYDCPAAIESRERYKQYTKAIIILEYHEKILTSRHKRKTCTKQTAILPNPKNKIS